MLSSGEVEYVRALLRDARDQTDVEAQVEADRLATEALRILGEERGQLYQEAVARQCSARRLVGQFASAWVSGAQVLHMGREGTRGHEALSVLPDIIECAIHLALPKDSIDQLITDVKLQVDDLDLDWLRAAVHLQESRVLRDRGLWALAASAASAAEALHRRSVGGGGYSATAHLQAVSRSLMDLGEYRDAERIYTTILETGSNHWSQVAAYIGLSKIALERSHVGDAVYLAQSALSEAHFMYPLAVQYALEALFDALVADSNRPAAQQISYEMVFYAERTDSVRRRYGALLRVQQFDDNVSTELARLRSVIRTSQGIV